MSVRKELCDLCGQSFSKLTDHVRDFHGDSCSSCDFCSKVFKSVKQRTDHVRNVHGETVPCDICEKTFKSKTYLKRHQILMHGVGKDLMCQYCENTFSSDFNLKRHENNTCTVKLMNNFKCPKCDKNFKNKQALSHHFKNHDNSSTSKKMDQCHICKVTISSKNMKRHVETHSTKVQVNNDIFIIEKEPKKFKCEHCNANFSRNFNLQRHLQTYHNIKDGTTEPSNIVYFKQNFISREYGDIPNLTLNSESDFEESILNSDVTNQTLNSEMECDDLPNLTFDSESDFEESSLNASYTSVSDADDWEDAIMDCDVGANDVDIVVDCVEQTKSLVEEIIDDITNKIFEDKNCIVCPECLKKYQSQKSYKQHYLTQHNSKTRFYCYVCHYFFASKHDLDTHKIHKHDLYSAKKPSKDPKDIGKRQQYRKAAQNAEIYDKLVGTHSDFTKQQTMKKIISGNEELYQEIIDGFKSRKDPLSTDEVISIILNAGLTDTQMELILKNLRIKYGNDIVTPGVHEALAQRKKIFEDYFTTEELNFHNKKEGEIKRSLVFCHDINGFIDKVCEMRSIARESQTNILAMDEGKGSLKLTLTLTDLNVEHTDDDEKKRTSHKDGIIKASEGNFKEYSVRKNFLLAIVFNVPETYSNIEVIFSKTKINEIHDSYLFSGDLKLLNIVCGLGTHSSKYPCVFCLSYKKSDGTWEKNAKKRTLEFSKRNSEGFKKSGHKTPIKFFSCEQQPLLNPMNAKKNSDGETNISDICVLPDLHLSLGAGNDIWNGLEKVCPEIMKELETKLGLQKTDYQGKKNFEGNGIKKILNNINLIEKEVPQEFSPFIDALDALKEVRHATYGNKLSYCSPRPAPYFDNVIKNFEDKYNILKDTFKVSITNKIHIMSEHIPEYIREKELSLGRSSDQLIESTHQHTNKIFSRSKYFVKNVSSPYHKKKLKMGLNHYNSYNV